MECADWSTLWVWRGSRPNCQVARSGAALIAGDFSIGMNNDFHFNLDLAGVSVCLHLLLVYIAAASQELRVLD
jgi:hypothetical protein